MNRQTLNRQLRDEEERIHRAAAEYLRLAISPPDWWTTFPAGGGGKARGGKLKAMGLKAGVPDILIVNGMNGVAHWVELKTEKGVKSPAQKEMHRIIQDGRGKVALCRSVDDLSDALKGWGFHLKARAL